MNRAARITTDNFELFKQVGVMNLKERRDYFMGGLAFNVIAPSYLCDVFTACRKHRYTRLRRNNADNLL